MAMRVLILGGSGFIGSRVPAALARLGHEGLIVSRTSKRAADRRDPASVARVAEAERCDALIDMIAYEPASTIALRDALAGKIGRYVLISSADVYRAYGGLHRLEACAPDAAPAHEDSPRRARLYPYRKDPPRDLSDPEAWQDSYDKIPIEDALAGPATTIVRLPMVYGPGDRNRRFRWIVTPMLAKADIAAPAAWLDWLTTYGHVEDVAAAIALCATHAEAAGKIYNCGERAMTHRIWIERFAAALDWRGETLADENAPITKALAGLDLRFPLAVDTSRIRGELGFTETLGPEKTLQSVIDEERAFFAHGRDA
jgi:nucleoside-diphosphate-sugar epimerase